MSNQVITLQQAEQVLENKLSSLKTLTVGDVATLTGLTTDDSKATLEKLMSKYVCRLKVTETGDLIYDFGTSLLRRGEKTLAEYWAEVKEFLWKAFQIFFKMWIAVTLVLYFVVFFVIIVGIIIAAMFGDSDSDIDVGDIFAGFFHALVEMFRMIFIWNTITGATYYETDSRGYKYKNYEPKGSTWNKNKKKAELPAKSFVAAVYDFVFGPPRVKVTFLDNLKELATYARRQNGIVVTSEIKGLTGYTSEQADQFMTESIVRFNGKAEITEEAVLYTDFDELTRSAAKNEVNAPVIWFWDEYEAEYKITGNSKKHNAMIISMNLFNLIVSFFVLGATVGNPEFSSWVAIVFGWIPLSFSTIFFSVPLLRSFSIFPKRKERHFNNIRKRLMKVIYQNPDKEILLSELENAVNAKGEGEENLSKQQIEKVMNDLIFDLQGDMEIDPNGNVVYKFPRLKTELQEAMRLRREKGFSNLSTNIVFDSGE
jgi:hypothetical protein